MVVAVEFLGVNSTRQLNYLNKDLLYRLHESRQFNNRLRKLARPALSIDTVFPKFITTVNSRKENKTMVPQPAIAPIRCLALKSSPTPTTLSSSTFVRTLTTTPLLRRQTPSHRTVPAPQLPEYPYGRFQTYKQRNEGLYGRSKIRFGNVVASKYGNKSRTSWLPNRHTKRLWSPSLNGFIRTRMTASVLHTIDKLGGIDEYLLGSKTKRIKELGPAGWALRWKIIQTPAVQERFARERAALGLPPKEKGDGGAVAADTPGFPAELAAEGLDSAAVIDEVDAMLARDEEFVLGDPAAEAEDVVVVEEAPDTPRQQAQKPE
ncbi:hypothetical protein FHL15_008087 [Xylaria flabelliformis]|uniref:Ribosomal protein L28 n=1 Tax=Xylaria flabelliformis TaxID=2512241 RepID=A0A553HT35_9PEZI|nr:hypothetical protein FHL15_008087 [Xylaria flabelliformis]